MGESVDTEVPTVSIVSPDPHAVFSICGDFLIQGTWKDDGTIKSVVVTLKQDKDKKAKEFSYNAVFNEHRDNEHIWQCMIPAASEAEITDGSYLVSVKITDMSGHNSTATSQIVIDNTPPLIALTRPSSASVDTEIDSYGQTFTLTGEAADDSGVSSIVMDIYSSADIENPENKLYTKTLKNVLNNIKLTVAQFKEGDETNDYYKIYKQATVENAIDKTFYCTITAYDGAVSFPSDGSGPIEKGNSIDTYYLRDSISDLLKSYKSTGLYHISAGNYEEQNVSADELNMDEYKITIGKFSLNPANNPKFNISDRFRITDNGVNSETAKVIDGEPIIVEVVPGLDGIAIDPDTLKMFTRKCDEHGNVLAGEEGEKKYLECSQPIGNETSYKVTAIISRNNYDYNSFYLIGIEGKDIQGNPVVAYVPNGYGFVFVSSGLLPSVTVETPADGAVFKKGADVEVKGTIYYPEEGEFSIRLNDEPLFTVTNESKISPESLTVGQLSYIKDEHTDGLYSFKYIIPAEKFNQSATLDYALTFPDRDATLAVPHGPADRSITYDVELPEVTLNFSGTAEDNELLGPLAYNFGEDGIRADTKEYLNAKFAFECKVNDNIGIDFTNSKIQIIEKTADDSENVKQTLAVNSENKTFKDVDTEGFANGSILVVRATIFDTAGNSTSTEASYEVNQTTDKPLIFPVNDAGNESTAKISFALDTKAKVQAQKDYNIVSADSPSVKLKFIDDDCIVGKNPILKFSYWKANQSESGDEPEVKEFSTNELENTDEFIIENAETDFYILKFIFIDGVDSTKTTEKQFCIRVAPKAPAVKLEDVSVEYVTNSSVENKTADAKVAITNKIIINSTEAPFRISSQVEKLDAEGNAQVIIPYKAFEELTDAVVTENSTDGTFVYENPYEIPESFENGKYQITYKVYDKSKQTSEDSITDAITFYVDKTPEEITDIEVSSSDSQPFVVTCTKNGDAPVEYYWSFTEADAAVPAYGASVYKKTAGVNNKVKLSDLFTSEGNKTVHVYAVDRAGNRSNIKSKNFIYDVSAPGAELVEKNFTSKDKFELNAKASDSWGIKKLELWQKKDNEEASKAAEQSYAESETLVTVANWKIENLPETIPEDTFAKYEYFVKAFDLADKTSNSEVITVTVDNKKPVCSITTPTEAVLNGSLGEISGTASDGASVTEGIGLKNLYYQLYRVNDAGEKTLFGSEETIELSGAINATWKISKTLGEGNDLTEGAYSLSVYAEDMAGNKGESKSINFFVDFAAPVVTSAKVGTLVLEKEKTVYLKTDTAISVSGTITETNGIKSVTINEQPANVALVDQNVSNGRYSFNVSELAIPPANEDFSIVIKVTDKAGLESVNNYIVHNDKTAPSVLFSKPIVGENRLLNGENSLYDKDFKFIGSFDDGIGSGAISYKYKISSTEITPTSDGTYAMTDWPGVSGKDFNIPKNLSKEGTDSTSEGLYYLYLYVEDKAGNSSTSWISYWVDEKQPEISSLTEINATGQNKDGIPVVNNTFTIGGTASDGNKIDYVEIKEGELLIKKFTNTESLEPFEFTESLAVAGENAVANGKHTYTVTAVDKAGRVSASSIKEVWVDTKLPDISVSGVTSPVAYTSSDSTETKWYKTSDIKFEISASDTTETGSGIFQVMASSNPSDDSSWVMFTEKDGSYNGSINCSKQGFNQVTFRAIDNAGNPKTINYSVYIDTESPVSAAIESLTVGQVPFTDFSNKILVNGSKYVIVSLSAQDFYAEEDTQKATGSGVKEITAKIGTQALTGVTSSYDTDKWTLTIPGDSLRSGTLIFDVKDNVENAAFEYTSDVIFELDNEEPDTAVINEVKNADTTDNTKKHVNKTFTLTGKAHDSNRLLSIELQYKKHNAEQWKSYTTIYDNLTSWSIPVNTTEKDSEENNIFEDKTLYDFQIIVLDTAQNSKTSAAKTVYVNQDSDIPVLTFKDMNLTEMDTANPAECGTNEIRIIVYDDDGKIKSLEYRIGEEGKWTTAILSNSSYILNLNDGTYNGEDKGLIYFKVVDAADGSFTAPKLKGKEDSSTDKTALYALVDTTAPYIQVLNVSRTGNNDDWINSALFNDYLGGDSQHNRLYLSITAYDANSVEEVSYQFSKGSEVIPVNMAIVSVQKKQDGFYYYQFKTVEPLSVQGLESGQYTLLVTVKDKKKERQTSKEFFIDNTPPEVLVHEHNNPDHIELIGSAFTLQGSFNNADVGTTLKYQVTDSPNTSNLSDDAWVEAEGVSVGYWKIYFDSKENGIEGGYTHGKSPKYLIADARSDLTISSEGKVVYTDNEPFEDPLLCYFHLKGTDSYGNYSIYSLPLKLDPLGEIPDIYLDSPEIPLNFTAENSKLVSGIIRLSGHVNAVNSIKRTAENPNSGVYIQIDPSFNGTFAENWHTKPMPSGKTFAEANYTIVSFGPEEKSKQGIYVDDNLSWAFQLNKKSNFETANGTSTIAFRLFVVDVENNVSRSDDVTYVMRVNAGVPKIGSSEELKLYRYGWSDSNGNLVGYTKSPTDTALYGINDPVCEGSSTGTRGDGLIYTPSIKDYKENMFLKGKWFLTGSVEDEDHISLFTINDIDAKSATEIEWTSEGNTKTYGYRIHHVVGNTANVSEVLTYKILAKDGNSETAESDKNDKEENIIIRVDNKGPEVALDTSENYGISKAIQNKDGFYKIKSAATESGDESGFLRTVFFFANGTSTNETPGRVYDSYIKNSKLYNEDPDNVLDCSSLKYEDGLYWKTGNVTAIDKSARQITLESTDVNLHTGGLVKLGGIIYTVKKIETSGTVLTLDGAPDLGRTVSSTSKAPLYIAIGHVVDHFGLESAGTTKNSAGYYSDISGDDDDCMMESVNTTGTTTRWEASINSHNLRDGAIEIHYVVFDKAGNYTETIINDAVVKNNAPRLASLKLWTDYNGNGSEDEGEYKTYYNSAKTRTFERADGHQYKEERATAVTENLNVYGEDSTAFMTIKGDNVTFTPEVIGGNGALYYSNAEETLQENRIQFNDSNNQPIYGTDSINGNYTETDKNGQSYIKGQTMSFVLAKENLGNNSDLTEFNYWIWDSTLGTRQLNSTMTVALKILNSTTENPKVEFTPFYWNSKDDNSLFENKRENGHIELVEALPTATFKTGNSGINDRDPKVSGKITIRGYVRDDIRLKQIKLQVPDFPGLTSEVLVAEYKIENGTAYWTGTDKMNDEHWKFSVTKDTNDGDGHKAEWEFSWDTSYIDGITKENAQVIVSAVAGKDSDTRYSDETKFQMDIVPYITKVITPLCDTASDNYRSAFGHYPVKPGDKLTLKGFNLQQGNTQGAITVTVGTDWKSGNLNSVTTNEKTYQFINGLNDNNASGEYTLKDEDKAQLTTSEGKDIYENLYNRQPDGLNNNTLTDDIYLDIWDFTEAVKPVKGHIDQPIMKINPATGIIGFAFADGSTYFSMGGNVIDNGSSSETDYSYNYWLGAYDRFTSIGFAYDKWGYSYGVAAGGDINGTPTLDAFSFMTSRWGVCEKKADASKNSSINKRRLERIGQNNGTVIVNKQRIQSPSLATTSYKDGQSKNTTNVYLAYFDDINKQIRFRAGSTNSTSTSSIGMIADDCTYNTAVTYNASNDTVKKVNLIAGKDSASGKEAGKNLSISVIPKAVSGEENDVVVIVWYDEENKTLWYGYNKTPIASGKGKGSGAEWVISRVFDETTIYECAGANCQIIADELGGVHIAAYDEDNGDLVYAYTDSPYDSKVTFKTCIVDSYGVVGSNISLDIALNEAGTVAVPRIGYYDISNGYPKYAYFVSENTEKLSGAENDMFTGNWECTIVPTTSNVSLDNSKQTNLINVGVWKDKDTGKIKNSTTGNNSQVNQFNGYNSTSYGVVYGNGSKNAVLGYLVAEDSSNDFIETAQIKPTN